MKSNTKLETLVGSRSRPTRAIASEQVATVVKELGTLDAWTIYKPEALIERGFPPELVKECTMDFESNLTDPKATIFSTQPESAGQILPAVRGVYSLYLARVIARALDVSYEPAFGRGTEYQNILRALSERTAVERGAKA